MSSGVWKWPAAAKNLELALNTVDNEYFTVTSTMLGYYA